MLFFATILFLLSLLTVFRAPTKGLWYVSILVTEFSWIFICLDLLLIIASWHIDHNRVFTIVVSLVSLLLYIVPYIAAYRISNTIKRDFDSAFQIVDPSPVSEKLPFRLSKIFNGIFDPKIKPEVLIYDTSRNLAIDFYRSSIAGLRPCIIVVHGGSWAGGDSKQLPELNTILANAGYHVAAINYRLAPQNIFPASIEDVEATINFLKQQSQLLSIDLHRFVLLGRSAGGQVVLAASDNIKDNSIKGVISFYGPADMIWGYANPTSKLVMDSRKIMEDYLGGTYDQVPHHYQKSSPVETASESSLPALLIYGENDPMVSHEHGSRLKIKYDQFAVPHFILTIPWATHGFDYTLYGPGGQLSTYTVLRFLKMLFPELSKSTEERPTKEQQKKPVGIHNN